jgi:hypothetical protein
LERMVRRLGRQLDPTPVQRHRVPRRSRRSAWCPGN